MLLAGPSEASNCSPEWDTARIESQVDRLRMADVLASWRRRRLTFHARAAGEGSAFPAWSTARTSKRWVPFLTL